MPARVNQAEFNEQLGVPERLTIIDFYSDSCIPCKRLSPLLAEVEESHPDIFIGKVNIAYEKELTAKEQVTATPTLIFYKNGEERQRITGAIRRDQLETAITANK